MKTIILRPTDDGCAREVDGLRGTYVNGRAIAAVLDLTRFNHEFPLYETEVLKARKGVWSDITRARREGYVVREYAHRAWLHDVVEIEASKPVRCGGPMRAPYLRSVEERGGADPNAVIVKPRCGRHWRQTWGVFAPQKLIAFCSLVRSDELAIYSMFIGHGAHLRAGVMHLLHAGLIRHLTSAPECAGIDFVMYGAAGDGGWGLMEWKNRLGFAPASLVMAVGAATGGV